MKKILFGIGAVIIVILLLLQTRFTTFMQMDYDGYAIEDKTLRALLLSDPDSVVEDDKVPLYKFDALDFIYKRGNSYYMGETKKTQVDMGFPMLINGGTGVWFADDTAVLFNVDYDEFSSYEGLMVSDRISYNPGGDRAADDEYLFAGLNNGFFMNLDTFSYDDHGLTREVAKNSAIYFTEEYFVYCEQLDGEMVYQICRNTPADAKVTINGEELTYRELLLNLHVIYDKVIKDDDKDGLEIPSPEVPTPEVIEQEVAVQGKEELPVKEEKEEKKKAERPVRERATKSSSGRAAASSPQRGKKEGTLGVRPDSLRPDKKPATVIPRQKEEGYIEPVVTASDPRAGVYRIMIDLTVEDPARRLDPLRKVQFEFYEEYTDAKGVKREKLITRAYGGATTAPDSPITAGNGQIKPNTTYRVNAYYTYSNEYGDKVTRSLYSDKVVTTGSTDSLGPVTFKIGSDGTLNYMDIPFYYDNYVEIVNVTYDKDNSDEEALYGIDPRKLVFTAKKKGSNDTYTTTVDSGTATLFKKGGLVTITSNNDLVPKSEYTYEITARDYFNTPGLVVLKNNTGEFKTCKSRPQGSITLEKNEIGDARFKIKVIDPHQSSIPPRSVTDRSKDANGVFTNTDRDVYLVVTKKNLKGYNNVSELIADADYYINNGDRRNKNAADESAVHYAHKMVKGTEYTVAADGSLQVPEQTFQADRLDLNETYYVYLLADYDLDNLKGEVFNGQIAEFDFKSATLSSIGSIYITVDIADITDHGATISYTLNDKKTDIKLQEYLSDITFNIKRGNGDEAVTDSQLHFKYDETTLKQFTAFDGAYDSGARTKSYNGGAVQPVIMDPHFFNGGFKEDNPPYSTPIENKVTDGSIAYSLKSMTDYKIEPEIYATYNGKQYDMKVVLSRSSFKTMRRPATVTIKDDVLAAGTLKFKVKIDDPDEAITGNSGHVVVLKIYDSKGKCVKVTRIPKNTDDFLAQEFTRLDSKERFYLRFIATEYNEGYTNATFESNHVLLVHPMEHPLDLSGTIKLQRLDDITVGLDKGKIEAKTKVVINDSKKILQSSNNEPYHIDLEKVVKNISGQETVTPITSVTKNDYSYDSSNRITENHNFALEKGNITYRATLYVYINSNKLILDTLEFNAKEKIIEVSSAADFIQKIKDNSTKVPGTDTTICTARFVATGDIDMNEVDYETVDGEKKLKETTPSANIVNIFNGEIDFQGYKLIKNKHRGGEDPLFNNIGPKGEIYNAVLEFSDDNTGYCNENGILTRNNYGHIHDVIVEYKGGSGAQNRSYGLLCWNNAASGIIERFVVHNAPDADKTTFSVRQNAGLVCDNNEGMIRNGYVYGDDINTVVAGTGIGGNINVGGIAGIQTSRGQMKNVFSLVNIVVTSPEKTANNVNDKQYGAIIGSASGSVRNMYSAGNEGGRYNVYNTTYSSGNAYAGDYDKTVIGSALGTNPTTQSNVYFYNDGDKYEFNKNAAGNNNNNRQKRIGLESLYDYSWQGGLLGSQFNTAPVEVGYYPQLTLSSELPDQEFIPLPDKTSNNIVEIVSTEVLSYAEDGNSAIVMMRLNNQRVAAIKEVEIEDLTVELFEDAEHQVTNVDGYTTIYMKVSDPKKYVSSYKIKSVTCGVGKSTSKVTPDGAYLLVDFYKLIHNEDEWYDFVVRKPNENARLANDIVFSAGRAWNKIHVSSDYNGKLDGGSGFGGAAKEANATKQGFTLDFSNVATVNSSGYATVFRSVYGEINNVVIKDYHSDVLNTSYNAFVFRLYGTISNVHMINPVITAGKDYMAPLLCRAEAGSSITNCSASNVKVTHKEAAGQNTSIYIGGLVAYATESHISNCFARDINLVSEDLKVCNGAGGVVGYSNITALKNLYATGDIVIRGGNVGGIVGYHYADNVSNVMNNLISRVNVENYQDRIGGVAGQVNLYRTLTEANNMRALALGNVLCHNTDSQNVSYTIGQLSGRRGTFYGTKCQLFNGVTDAVFDGDGKFVIDGVTPAVIKECDNNTRGLLSYEDIKKSSTYTTVLEMDAGSYDFSKAEREILPTLYYEDTNEPMPFQPDTPLSLNIVQEKTNPIKVTDVFVDTNQRDIVMRIMGPVGYAIKDVTIDKLELEANPVGGAFTGTGKIVGGVIQDNGRGIMRVRYRATDGKILDSVHYLDSYMMTQMMYTTPSSPALVRADFSAEPVRVPLTLYGDIKDNTTWNAAFGGKHDYENFRVLYDLNFGNGLDWKMDAKVGRLEGATQTTPTAEKPGAMAKIYNINSTGSKNVIFRLNSELSKLEFNNVTIASSGRTNAGIIGSSSGYVHDMWFEDCTVTDSGTNEYVGLIGSQSGSSVGKYSDKTLETQVDGRIVLKNIKVGLNKKSAATANSRVGGLLGHVSGNAKIENISAENVEVYGHNNVGGIVGSSGNGFYRHIRAKDFIVTAKGNYVGGIIGDFTCSCTSAANGGYFSDIQLTGTPVKDSNGFTTDSTTIIGHDLSSDPAKASYCGGLTGRLQPYWVGKTHSSVEGRRNTKILKSSKDTLKYDVDYASNYVDGIVVKGCGSYIGGMYGASNYLYDSKCFNSYITAVKDVTTPYSNVGGISGSNGYDLHNSLVHKTWIDVNNHNHLGLAVGNYSAYGSAQNDKVEESKIDITNTLGTDKNLRNVGGMFGYANYQMYYCSVVNTSIKAKDYFNVGGIGGYTNYFLTRCFYYADPENRDSPAADETKYRVEGYDYVGGIVGYQYQNTIGNCYSNANVIAEDKYAGGLVGMYRNNYITTKVNGKTTYNYSAVSLAYNYFMGTVRAKDYAGGLIGRLGLSSVGTAGDMERGGRRTAAVKNELNTALGPDYLSQTGSNNEAAYTYCNMSFAGRIETTEGPHAYAYAGSNNGFEGKANRYNNLTQATPYKDKDRSTGDLADRTILWGKTQIIAQENASSPSYTTTLDQIKKTGNGYSWLETPPWAENTSSAAATRNQLAGGEEARYVPYREDGGMAVYGPGTDANESNASKARGQINVRIVSGSDMKKHGPYFVITYLAQQTTNQAGRSWRGNTYHVLFTEDNVTKPTGAPYSAYTDKYVGTTLFPHVRVNGNTSGTLNDYLTNYQVAMGIAVPIPNDAIPARRMMARRGMPEITAPDVYASDVDKINVDFTDAAIGRAYLMLYYGSDPEPVAKILVKQRTYTFSYDFAKKLRIDYGYVDMYGFTSAMEEAGKEYKEEDVLNDFAYLTSYTTEEPEEDMTAGTTGTEGGNTSENGEKKQSILGGLVNKITGNTGSSKEPDKLDTLDADDVKLEDDPDRLLPDDSGITSPDEGELPVTEDNSAIDGSSEGSTNAATAAKTMDDYIYKARQLARRVMTYGNRYYYVTEDGVVTGTGSTASEGEEDTSEYGDSSAELIAGDFVHIYNGKGLTRDGNIIDLAGGGNIGKVEEVKLLDAVTPLEDYTYNDRHLQTYWKYTTIYADTEFNREQQILKSSNGNSDVIDGEVPNVKDSVVMYDKNGQSYLTVLGTDGIMIDMYQGDDLNAPEDFKSSGIVYMTNNFNTTAPFIVVEYQNGGVVGYNYMTGEYLFNNFKKNEMSLIDYLKVYFDGDKSLLKTASNSYSVNSKVAEIAGSPDRLAKMVEGTNSGDRVKDHTVEGAETAKDDESAKAWADEDKTAKAGDRTELRGSELDTGFNSTNEGEEGAEAHGSLEQTDKSSGAKGMDGLVVGMGSTEYGTGEGTGETSSGRTEGAGSSNTDEGIETASAGHAMTEKDTEGSASGSSMANGGGGGKQDVTAHGNGAGDGLANEDMFADSTTEKAERSGSVAERRNMGRSAASTVSGKASGNGETPASGTNDSDDSTDKAAGSGDGKGRGTADDSIAAATGKANGAGAATGNGAAKDSEQLASAADDLTETIGDDTKKNAGDKDKTSSKLLDNDMTEADAEDGLDMMLVEKHASKTEDMLDGSGKADDSGDKIKSEKNLKTLYNPATGQYEIVDMDRFLSQPGYQSENARLAVKDFSAYGGYATPDKPQDEENHRGIALYLLASLAVIGGVGGGIYYRKKHKMKV